MIEAFPVFFWDAFLKMVLFTWKRQKVFIFAIIMIQFLKFVFEKIGK
jgi:hypothetical protein